jgi:hypothetical protein
LPLFDKVLAKIFCIHKNNRFVKIEEDKIDLGFGGIIRNEAA